MAFLRMLLLEDDGPAHHDCRLRVLAAAGTSNGENVGQVIDNSLKSCHVIDCSAWPPEYVEQWMGEGGLIALSKVRIPPDEELDAPTRCLDPP
jgi:hypothetical protein